MNYKHISQMVFFLSMLLFYEAFAYVENIDPNDDGSQYAYGENVGWLSFEPNLCVTGVL